MAVVQISRIQLRRGRENVDGIPQLASGEMAWAVDTQQLYIGNGSINEGAPEVGNTKILTGADLTGENNILNIANYRYLKDPSLPARPVQNRLDERVNIDSFNNIQEAIDFLYKSTPSKRTILEFGPGVYEFSTTIRIHSHTHIVGAGVNRTIFKYTPSVGTPQGTGVAFRLVNDQTTNTSAPTNTAENQCKMVNLVGFSLVVNDVISTAMVLNSVKDSQFKDLEITSNWDQNRAGQTSSVNNKAIEMLSTSEDVTCSNNLFDNLNISKFRIGVNARGDINSNIIENCNFSINEVGINFGQDANLVDYGQKYGPRNNIITNNIFKNVQKQGIKLYNGTTNFSGQNNFILVGNNFGNSLNSAYGVVEFDVPGNLISNSTSDRHTDLSSGEGLYISEVIAKANYINPLTNVKTLEYTTTPTKLFRLPIAQTCHLEVEYLYQSTNKNRIRRGKLSILADVTHLDNTGKPTIEFVDEYDYHGTGSETDYTIEDIHLIFSASSRTYNGVRYIVEIFYQYNGETLSQGEQAKLTYTYKILS